MDDLIEFLRARLAEDEEAARQAADGDSGAWFVGDQWNVYRAENAAPHEDVEENPLVVYGNVQPQSEHIARYAPARVLAEVQAKRRILALHVPEERPPETDAELHARCAHPAYEYATTEGQRKQWDDVDVPPRGDDGMPDQSWEPNTDAGRDGWGRFDYTEESYWRRLRPGGPCAPRIPEELRLLASVYADHPGYRPEWAPDA